MSSFAIISSPWTLEISKPHISEKMVPLRGGFFFVSSKKVFLYSLPFCCWHKLDTAFSITQSIHPILGIYSIVTWQEPRFKRTPPCFLAAKNWREAAITQLTIHGKHIEQSIPSFHPHDNSWVRLVGRRQERVHASLNP